MADLYEVEDGDVALGEDVNQYKDALEGGSVQQYALKQKAGANFKIKMATANGTDSVQFLDSADVEVAAIDSDGKLTMNSIILPLASTPAQTANGSMVWDSNDFRLTVGDGTTRATFTPQVISRSTSNFTKNNNDTLGDVTGISFTIGASEVWAFNVYAQASIGATPDIKLAFTVPSGATATGLATKMNGAGVLNIRVSDWTASNALADGSAGVGLQLSGVVVASSTAGTVQMQAAQNSATSEDTILYAQSYIIATRIA